jgi:phage terminase small subunit
MGLTIKQENFCNYYLECGNAAEAYRRAYNAERMKDESVWIEASKLLNNPKVALRVKELQEQLKAKSDLKKEDTVKWISELVNFDAVECLFVNNLSDIPLQYRRLVKSVKPSNEGFVVEIFDKQKAIDQICRMLGWDEAEKIQVQSGDMSEDEALAIIKKLKLKL